MSCAHKAFILIGKDLSHRSNKKKNKGVNDKVTEESLSDKL